MIKLLQRCLKRLQNSRISAFIKQGDYQKAKIGLSEIGGFDSNIKLFNLEVRELNFENAANQIQVLKSMATTESQNDLIFVKEISLIKSMEGSEFAFTESQNQVLLDISNKGHVYSAYARILYFKSTGILIYDLPSINRNSKRQVVNERELIEEDGFSYKIFPNPVSNILTIDLGQNSCSFKFVDIYGNLTTEGIVNGEKRINIVNLKTGIYTIILENSKGEIFFERIMKN